MSPRPAAWFVRAGALASVLVAIAAVFLLAVRPWYLEWGTTADERARPLPGDDIVSGGGNQETRAITIDAPVERVWPWVAQTGQDRGGFYSFDLLENLVGCEMPVDDRLNPALQAWTLGDKLWMYPPNKAGGAGFATLRVYVPGRALGFATRRFGTALSATEDGSWSFVLDPVDTGATRLLIRGRGAPGRSLLGVSFDHAIFEPVHFTMERRMMIGIKQLAEGHGRPRWSNHVHVVLWTTVFVLFVLNAGRVISGRTWGRSLLLLAVSAGLFQWLTLGQPAVWIGALVTSGLAMATFRRGR